MSEFTHRLIEYFSDPVNAFHFVLIVGLILVFTLYLLKVTWAERRKSFGAYCKNMLIIAFMIAAMHHYLEYVFSDQSLREIYDVVLSAIKR